MTRPPDSPFPPFAKIELETAFANSAPEHRYSAILTVDQAAGLLQIPPSTIYDWSSRGLLRGCSRRIGKHLRIFRDRLLHKVFCEGL